MWWCNARQTLSQFFQPQDLEIGVFYKLRNVVRRILKLQNCERVCWVVPRFLFPSALETPRWDVSTFERSKGKYDHCIIQLCTLENSLENQLIPFVVVCCSLKCFHLKQGHPGTTCTEIEVAISDHL